MLSESSYQDNSHYLRLQILKYIEGNMIVKEYPSLTKLHWEEDVKAVRAEWTTFSIKLDQFKEILDFYLNYASEKKIKNWIVDSANTVGFVSDEINAWLQSE